MTRGDFIALVWRAVPSAVLPRRPLKSAFAVAGLVAAVYALLAGLLIVSQHISQRNFVDQNLFHRKAIFRFVDQWPRLDFSDYESATTPGYHVTLAFVHIWVTSDPVFLGLIAMTFGVALVWIVAFALGRRLPPAHAVCLGLPLAFSPYVICSGAYLLPDNSAWWIVAALLVLALRPRMNVGLILVGGVLATLLVLFRQIHLWAAGLVWLAAVAHTITPADDEPWAPGELAVPVVDLSRPLVSARWLALGVLMTLPAFGVIAYFVRLWGGLAPPSFHAGRADPETNLATAVAGWNLATPAFILAIVAFVGTPLLGYLWPFRRRVPWVLVTFGALVGLVLAAAPPTSWSLSEGRYSGLWNIPRFVPSFTVFDRALPIIALATLGGAIAVLLLAWLSRRERFVFAGALAAFVAAHTLSALAWQRYFEPFVIMWCVLAVASIAARAAPRPPAWAALGPLVLTGVLAVAAWSAIR